MSYEDCRNHFWGLRGHREGLRKQTRTAHLAHGFIRGRSYREMEYACWVEPDWKAVEDTVIKFSNTDERETRQKFAEWLGSIEDRVVTTSGYVQFRQPCRGPKLAAKPRFTYELRTVGEDDLDKGLEGYFDVVHVGDRYFHIVDTETGMEMDGPTISPDEPPNTFAEIKQEADSWFEALL